MTSGAWRSGLRVLLALVGMQSFCLITATGGQAPLDMAPQSGLLGSYFANPKLAGPPVLQRVDASVDFNWGLASPADGIPEDDFSVRWSGQVEVPETGAWTFLTESDDGVRLAVDGVLLVDNWTRHPVMENDGRIELERGRKYDLVLEYFDTRHHALMRLLWEGPATPRQIVPADSLTPQPLPGIILPPPLDPARLPPGACGLIGHYYDNPNLAGDAVLRLDPRVDFDWGAGMTKVSGLGADFFSVRWTGQIQAGETGWHTFYVDVDDGARLWVNGRLLIDAWAVQSVTEHSGRIQLDRGRLYDLVLEYYEQDREAIVSLSWAPPSGVKSIIPSDRLFPKVIHLNDRDRGLVSQ